MIQAVRGNENSHFRMWQTPVADDAVNRSKGKLNSRGEPKLSAQVKLCPTPHGFSPDGRTNGPSGNELGRAVNRAAAEMFPTPTVQDAKNNGGPSQMDRNTKPLNAVVGGSLNPTWVEWLMGWPLGWTDCAASATGRFQQWLRLHGRCFHE